MNLFDIESAYIARLQAAAPAGVTIDCDVAITTRSPTSTSRVLASSLPITMPYVPGCKASNEPSFIFAGSSDTPRSSSGRMPVTATPALSPPAISSACSSM